MTRLTVVLWGFSERWGFCSHFKLFGGLSRVQGYKNLRGLQIIKDHQRICNLLSERQAEKPVVKDICNMKPLLGVLDKQALDQVTCFITHPDRQFKLSRLNLYKGVLHR